MRFRVLAPLSLWSMGAVVGLTEEQAAPRAHGLRSVGAGRYEVTRTVQFKAGEVIEYDGILPKNLAEPVVEVLPVALADAKAPKAKKRKG